MKCGMLFYACVMSLLVGCSQTSRIEPVESGTDPATMGGVTVGAQGDQASIQAELSDGPGIAALINKNYNENTTSCTEYGTGKARGYYFCTGVLLRTTDVGAFNPWESSPTALQLLGTSYSWIRHDYNTTGFFKRAGFILLSPADVLAHAVPGITYPIYASTRNPAVQCVYPFDAWTTRTMNRSALGCDVEGTGIGYPPTRDYAWGSCDNRYGYSTAAQWDQHFRNVGQLNYRQCSWNADNTQGWRNAISSHGNFTGQSSWSEVMFYNGGPANSPNLPGWNKGMHAWVVAFFYDVAKVGALGDAQSFQKKMAATGKRVPILRINFSAPAASRFQFEVADQAAYP